MIWGSAAHRRVCTNSILTAARGWSLPLAANLRLGDIITIADMVGGVNGANVISVLAVGSDTINGAASFNISAQFGKVAFMSNGVNRWVVV